MSKGSSFGKSLKGVGSLSARFLGPIEDAILNSISSGGIELSNVNITGGTVDGFVIGGDNPGPGFFTTLQTGDDSGIGYLVCFYGSVPGDHACWEPLTSKWNIDGNLRVRNVSDLGNLRVSSNTISSTNPNGSINLVANGIGSVNISGGINQSSASGDIIFNGDDGSFYVDTSNIELRTKTGDLSLEAGYLVPPVTITNIGITPVNGLATVTTLGNHTYNINDKIKVVSDGIIDNYYTVVSTPTLNTLTIQLPTGIGVPMALTSGTITLRSDINLTAKDFINVSVDTEITLGGNQSISGDILGNIFLSPVSGKSTIISGDLIVNGNTTTIESTTLSITDPVINTGGNDTLIANDNKDRGISSNYFNGGPKLSFFGRSAATGCFTYIPDAINTNEVFTGAKGCADFDEVSATTINLQGGTLTDACNITCDGDMVITGGDSITLETPLLSTSSPLLNLDSIPSIKDTGITFNYLNPGAQTGFMGWDTSQNSFTFLTNTTNTNGVITGTPGNITTGNVTIQGDLEITGEIIGLSASVERLTLTTGNDGTPTANKNITFVSVNSINTTIIGTLTAPIKDGFIKNINISSLASNSKYHIICPLGILLDPGSGSSAAKTLKFDCAGQGIHMVWDNVLGSYMIINAGCSIE